MIAAELPILPFYGFRQRVSGRSKGFGMYSTHEQPTGHVVRLLRSTCPGVAPGARFTTDGSAIMLRDYLARSTLAWGLVFPADMIPRTRSSTPHALAVEWIKDATGYSQREIAQLLGLTRMALNAWKRGRSISTDNRKRLFAVKEILSRARDSHRSQAELSAWLDSPVGRNGRTPAELLKANELNIARYLAMSKAATGVMSPPAWVSRVPGDTLEDAEYVAESTPFSRGDLGDSEEQVATVGPVECSGD